MGKSKKSKKGAAAVITMKEQKKKNSNFLLASAIIMVLSVLAYAFWNTGFVKQRKEIQENTPEFMEPQLAKVTNKSANMEKLMKSDLQKRKAYLQQWLAGANKVIELTQDPMAKELMEFARDNHSLYMPNDRMAMVVLEEDKYKEGDFGILFVDRDDLQKYPAWSKMIHSGAVGYYHPYFRSILIPITERSETARGIAFLHEIHHARDMFGEPPKKMPTQRSVTVTEIPIHIFQNRLIEKIGGQDYTDFINTTVKKMKEAEMKYCYPEELDKNTQIFEPNMKLFAKIYGNGTELPQSEYVFAMTNYMIASCFQLLDEVHKEKANDMKIEFMDKMYAENAF